MKDYSNDPDDYPQVVERTSRSFNWRYLILAVVLAIVFLYWVPLYEFVLKQSALIKQAVVQQTPEENKPVTSGAIRPASPDEILMNAINNERKGNRPVAHIYFQELLKLVKQSATYSEQDIVYLRRAAVFYSRGNEIPAEQVEALFQDAYLAVTKNYGNVHPELEYILAGLEAYYLSQGRYEEAATQTSLLLDFFQRKYQSDKDTQYNFIQPTTMRLGQNLLKAGKVTEARAAFQAALDMTKKRRQPTSQIDEFIRQTYKQANPPPATITESPKIPASLGSHIATVDPAPAFVAPTDVKSAIEAISLNGLYVEQLLEQDKRINILGYADNNKVIAEYMRLLQKKIGEPTLNLIKQEVRDQKKVNAFSISMKLNK